MLPVYHTVAHVNAPHISVQSSTGVYYQFAGGLKKKKSHDSRSQFAKSLTRTMPEGGWGEHMHACHATCEKTNENGTAKDDSPCCALCGIPSNGAKHGVRLRAGVKISN